MQIMIVEMRSTDIMWVDCAWKAQSSQRPPMHWLLDPLPLCLRQNKRSQPPRLIQTEYAHTSIAAKLQPSNSHLSKGGCFFINIGDGISSCSVSSISLLTVSIGNLIIAALLSYVIIWVSCYSVTGANFSFFKYLLKWLPQFSQYESRMLTWV